LVTIVWDIGVLAIVERAVVTVTHILTSLSRVSGWSARYRTNAIGSGAELNLDLIRGR
jgi:hypothetical protein